MLYILFTIVICVSFCNKLNEPDEGLNSAVIKQQFDIK